MTDIIFDAIGEKQELDLTYVPESSSSNYKYLNLKPAEEGVVGIEKGVSKFTLEALKQGVTEVDIYDESILNDVRKVGSFKFTVNIETK